MPYFLPRSTVLFMYFCLQQRKMPDQQRPDVTTALILSFPFLTVSMDSTATDGGRDDEWTATTDDEATRS
ncbi:unnamed protein product [Gongylonema pulchrum]|uniref:Secreted protein n=1 Tax=Gongylonema pulchrum TaxID=637853 RepID=A0A183E9H8_9BILA|nr:unnamed protein product [Gongylonema pulchrum]